MAGWTGQPMRPPPDVATTAGGGGGGGGGGGSGPPRSARGVPASGVGGWGFVGQAVVPGFGLPPAFRRPATSPYSSTRSLPRVASATGVGAAAAGSPTAAAPAAAAVAAAAPGAGATERAGFLGSSCPLAFPSSPRVSPRRVSTAPIAKPGYPLSARHQRPRSKGIQCLLSARGPGSEGGGLSGRFAGAAWGQPRRRASLVSAELLWCGEALEVSPPPLEELWGSDSEVLKIKQRTLAIHKRTMEIFHRADEMERKCKEEEEERRQRGSFLTTAAAAQGRGGGGSGCGGRGEDEAPAEGSGQEQGAPRRSPPRSPANRGFHPSRVSPRGLRSPAAGSARQSGAAASPAPGAGGTGSARPSADVPPQVAAAVAAAVAEAEAPLFPSSPSRGPRTTRTAVTSRRLSVSESSVGSGGPPGGADEPISPPRRAASPPAAGALLLPEKGASASAAPPIPPPRGGGQRGRATRARQTAGPHNPNTSHETTTTGHQVARTFYVDGQELAAAMSATSVFPSASELHDSTSERRAGGISVVAHLIKNATNIEYFVPLRNTDELLRYCEKSAKGKRSPGFEALIDCLELYVGPSGGYELRVAGWIPPEERAEQAKQEAGTEVAEMIRGLNLNKRFTLSS